MYKPNKSKNQVRKLLWLLIIFVFALLASSFILYTNYLKHQEERRLKIQENIRKRQEILELEKKDKEKEKEIVVKKIEEVKKDEQQALPPIITESKEGFPTLKAADGRENMDNPYLLKDIILVNRRHRVNWNYVPELAANKLLQPEAWEAFNKMLADANKEGINFFIRSGYRSFAKQVELYNYYLNTDPGGQKKLIPIQPLQVPVNTKQV